MRTTDSGKNKTPSRQSPRPALSSSYNARRKRTADALFPNHKHLEIILSRGKTAKFDTEDLPKITKYYWACRSKGNTWYAQTSFRYKTLVMHHIVLGIDMINNPLPDGMVVDHINGDGLDNRKSNLRVVTISENRKNTFFDKGVRIRKLPAKAEGQKAI